MDTARIDGFVRACLPSVSSTRTRHEVCMYTMTPDEHFIIDRHPDNSRAVYAAGFSGHGFKFAAGMGECLADMTLHETRLPELDFLAAARFPSGNGGSD
ncbi:MAG: FAD-dependent oxidoreductase [bacterium]